MYGFTFVGGVKVWKHLCCGGGPAPLWIKTMNAQQLDFLIKALLDGVDDSPELANRAGVTVEEIEPLQGELERGISLIRGFRQFASENAKPAGLPPPTNLYLNREADMDEQSPEYYAFEAVQRGNTNLEKCIFTCTQLGLDEETAKAAIENVCIPWRETNGWRSYAQQRAEGALILMDKTPVKIKRPLQRLKERCAALLKK